MRFKPVDKLRSLLAGSTAPASVGQRLKAWRAGFSGTTWLLYDLDNNRPSDFVPDAKSSAMANINGPVARSVLRNKLLFENVVGSLARVPKTYVVVERGTVTALHPGWQSTNVTRFVSFLVSTGSSVIIKPVDSSEGRGVHRLEATADGLTLDKLPTSEEAVRSVLNSSPSVMVCELIEQGGFSGRAFPGAVNTIRVVTMVDPDNGEPFVVSALHRFGTSKSAPTDNASRGGIRSLVDTETGVLSAAGTSRAFHRTGHKWPFDTHPETGEQLAGIVLDGWEDVKLLIFDVLKKLPFLLYVGWDVAITERGIVLVEGNHSPNLTQQVAGPYLADKRVRRFLEHHGVIP